MRPEDARHCPRCGAPVERDGTRSATCRSCGHTTFFNPSPVAGAIPRTDEGHVVLLRRGFAPGKGLWTFPGGFVDLGESVEDAALRETREELELEVALGDLVGVYSRADDRIVLVVFAAGALGTPRTTPEATEVRAFPPAEVPWGELAFWSTEQALRDLLGRPAR